MFIMRYTKLPYTRFVIPRVLSPRSRVSPKFRFTVLYCPHIYIVLPSSRDERELGVFSTVRVRTPIVSYIHSIVAGIHLLITIRNQSIEY